MQTIETPDTAPTSETTCTGSPSVICSDCGAKSICLYNVDGTVDSICIACVKEARDVGAAHAYAIRIHRNIHGYDGPDCPRCQVEDAHSVLWGDPGYRYDA